MHEMPPATLEIGDIANPPGPEFSVDDFIFDQKPSALWTLQQHGIAKGSALILGLAHHHEGDDLQLPVDGLHFSSLWDLQ